MAKKGTRLERALQNGSHRKRKPVGTPLKRLAKLIAVKAAILQRRKHKNSE